MQGDSNVWAKPTPQSNIVCPLSSPSNDKFPTGISFERATLGKVRDSRADALQRGSLALEWTRALIKPLH